MFFLLLRNELKGVGEIVNIWKKKLKISWILFNFRMTKCCDFLLIFNGYPPPLLKLRKIFYSENNTTAEQPTDQKK